MNNEVGQDNLNKKAYPECKVTLFLENHIDAAAIVKASIKLLPFFTQNDFKTFCLETTKDKYEEYMENSMTAELARLPSCVLYDNSKKSDELKKKDCDGLAENADSKMELIKSLRKNNLDYCAMDKKHSGENLGWAASFDSSRDEHMGKKISEACQNGNVLASVGFAHYKAIRENLVKEGLLADNIRGYYAPSEPIPVYTTRAETYERNLRSIQDPYFEHQNDNIVIIDLFKDSTLNVTSILREDYTNYLNKLSLSGEGVINHDEL